MKRAVIVCALAACNTDVVVSPIVDVPLNETAQTFGLDSITLSVAHNGNDLDITSATFTKGQSIELAGAPYSDDLVLHMVGRVGTSDVAYGRTCAFTINQNATVPQPHLYFARTAKFGQLGFTPLLRVGGMAVSYHDGSGLLIGGASGGAAVTDVERFDATTGEFRPLTSVSPRTGSVIALLGTGNQTLVTVIGGSDGSGNGATYLETIEAENPADRRVERFDDSTTSSMARVGLTATTLTNGDAIVIGGSGAGSMCGSGIDPSACVEEITLMNGSPSVRPAHGTLLHGRWNHTATRLGDDIGAPVLVVGGMGSGNGSAAPAPVAEAELYKPLAHGFSTTFSASMKIPRWGHQAMRLRDGSVVIIGGIDAFGNPVRQVEVFTLDSGFSAPTMTILPDSAGVVDFTATSLPDGRVLVTGGRATPGGPPLASAVILATNTDTGDIDVLSTDALTVPRAGHGATLLCDGTVLLSGGTIVPEPAERYNPPATGRR